VRRRIVIALLLAAFGIGVGVYVLLRRRGASWPRRLLRAPQAGQADMVRS